MEYILPYYILLFGDYYTTLYYLIYWESRSEVGILLFIYKGSI